MSRTIIKVPGFTAEASLFTSRDNYRSKARYTYPATAQLVVPQLEACLCCTECHKLGGDPVVCANRCHPHTTPKNRLS